MKRSAQFIIGTLLALIILAPALAWEAHEVSPDLTRQIRLEIQSDVLGETRPVDIYLPRAYARLPDEPFAVVYVLDGEESFHYAAGVLDALYQRGFPSLILVALPNTHRGRDLTPEAWGETPSGGGADAFASFFADELIPAVEARVRARDFRVLIGHSYGGLFATHALATRPGLFDAYVAISPSMVYAEGRPLETLASAFEAPRDERVPLYVAMGAEPGGEGDSIHQLYSLLAAHAPRWLDWDFDLYPEEDHSSVTVVATMAGLRYVFGDFVLEGRNIPDTVDGVVAHYDSVSERFGWRVEPPQRVLANLGFRQLEQGELEAAIETFDVFTRIYPTMIMGWDALAEAHIRNGDVETGIYALERLLVLEPGARDARMRLDDLRSGETD